MSDILTWADVVESVELRFPFPIELRASGGRFLDDVQLMAILTVPDRDTGERTRVLFHDYPPRLQTIAPDPADLEPAVRYLRGFVLKALAHEVDEALHVQGKRFHDPHTQETNVPRYL